MSSLEFLREWFGIHAGRELGNPERWFTDKPADLAEHVQRCNDLKRPCFVSVQPYATRDQVYGLEKLFFDFDCKEDLHKAWEEVSSFAESLIQYYKVLPLLKSSGNKGYHVDVFLKSTVTFPTWRLDFAKQIYDQLQKKLLAGSKFETLDVGVLGDIKRLERVPFSTHEKTGKQCAPVSLTHRFIQPRTLEVYRQYGLDTCLIGDVCKELKREQRRQEIRRKRQHSNSFEGNSVRPCIEAALTLPLDKGEGHKMRIGIAAEFLNKGFSVDHTINVFRTQADFDENRTQYFVQDIQRKGYRPFKCSTINHLGFCLKDECPIYNRRRSGK